MKRTLSAVMALLVIGFSLVSCKNEPEEGYKSVESPTCDFSFSCPESWDVTYTEGMLSVMAPSDAVKANVTGFSFFDEAAKDKTPLDYWNEVYKVQFEETFSTMNVTKTEETTLSGIIAQHVFYTVDLGKDSFNCQTVICVYGSEVFTLTLTSGAQTEENKDVYTDYSEDFERIISSFRIG